MLIVGFSTAIIASNNAIEDVIHKPISSIAKGN
jgi:hypothetical protein